MPLTNTLLYCCSCQDRRHHSFQSVSALPCSASVGLAGRIPGCCPELTLPSAAGLALPGPWRGSWCISWPTGASRSCSVFCQVGGWEWASSAWQRRCWHFAASTSPWCWWRSSLSFLRRCKAKEMVSECWIPLAFTQAAFLGALGPLGQWQAQSSGARLLIFILSGWCSCYACPSQIHPKIMIRSIGDATECQSSVRNLLTKEVKEFNFLIKAFGAATRPASPGSSEFSCSRIPNRQCICHPTRLRESHIGTSYGGKEADSVQSTSTHSQTHFTPRWSLHSAGQSLVIPGWN